MEGCISKNLLIAFKNSFLALKGRIITARATPWVMVDKEFLKEFSKNKFPISKCLIPKLNIKHMRTKLFILFFEP